MSGVLSVFDEALNIVKNLETTMQNWGMGMKYNGYTPFHYVACLDEGCDGLVTKITALKMLGRNINQGDGDGYSPLLHSIQSGGIDNIKALIKGGAAVDSQDKSGFSALHYACQNMNLEALQTLLNNGANINIVDKNGETPLSYTIKNEKGNDIIEYLIEQGADTGFAANPIQYAAYVGNLAGLKMLIDKGYKIGDPQKLLVYAGLGGDLDMINYLLSKLELDIDARDNDGRSAIEVLCYNLGTDKSSVDQTEKYKIAIKCLVNNGAKLGVDFVDGQGVYTPEVLDYVLKCLADFNPPTTSDIKGVCLTGEDASESQENGSSDDLN